MSSVRRRGAAAFAASCLVACSVQAGSLYLNGHTLDTALEPPAAPLDEADCSDYQQEAQRVADEVSKAHQVCLDEHRGAPGSGGAGDKVCSIAACQKLHTAMRETASNLASGLQQCRAALRERERNDIGPSSHVSSGELSLADIGAKLASGPRSRVTAYVRDRFAMAVSQVFGVGMDTAKSTVNGVFLARAMVDQGKSIQEACLAAKRPDVSLTCGREMLSQVQGLAARVPGRMKGDPAVALVQQAMLQRLYLIQADTLAQLEDATNKAEAVGADEHRRSPPRDRKSGTGRIENQ